MRVWGETNKNQSGYYLFGLNHGYKSMVFILLQNYSFYYKIISEFKLIISYGKEKI